MPKIAGYKKELFTHLTAIPGKSVNVVEFGVGTGPNFKYYANPATASHLNVIGVDPNKKMEKYARAAATAAGLPPANFTFMRGVCIIFLPFQMDGYLQVTITYH